MHTTTQNAKADSTTLLTIAEAAKRLAVSKATLYRRINGGEIRSLKLGALRRVPLAELCRIAASAT